MVKHSSSFFDFFKALWYVLRGRSLIVDREWYDKLERGQVDLIRIGNVIDSLVPHMRGHQEVITDLGDNDAAVARFIIKGTKRIKFFTEMIAREIPEDTPRPPLTDENKLAYMMGMSDAHALVYNASTVDCDNLWIWQEGLPTPPTTQEVPAELEEK
jgi:hypothetical protein